MSSWGNFYSKSFQLDVDIVNKLGTLLTDQNTSDSLLDQISSKLLDHPLNIPDFDHLDVENLSKEALARCYSIVVETNKQLTKLFEKANEERKALRAHNFTLLRKIFEMENAVKEGLDKNFLQFSNKSVFMSLELQKTFVERERKNNAKLEQVIDSKNKEIEELKQERDFLLKKLGILAGYDCIEAHHSTGSSAKSSIGANPRKTQKNTAEEFDAAIQEKILRRINQLQTENIKRSPDMMLTGPMYEETFSDLSPSKSYHSPLIAHSLRLNATITNGDDDPLSAEFHTKKKTSKYNANGRISKTPRSNGKADVSSSFIIDNTAPSGNKTFYKGKKEDPPATQRSTLKPGKSTTPSAKSLLNLKGQPKEVPKTTKANNPNTSYFVSAKASETRKSTITPKSLAQTSRSTLQPKKETKSSWNLQQKDSKSGSTLNQSEILNASFDRPSKNTLDTSLDNIGKDSQSGAKTPKGTLKRNATVALLGADADYGFQRKEKPGVTNSKSKAKLLSIVNSTLEPKKVNKAGIKKEVSERSILSQSMSEAIKSAILEGGGGGEENGARKAEEEELATERARKEKLIQNEIKKRILREKLRGADEDSGQTPDDQGINETQSCNKM